MFLILQLTENNNCYQYNQNSVIGIYDDFAKAKSSLINYLTQSKYLFEYELDYEDCLFIRCIERANIEISRPICFEIISKNIHINELRI